MEVKKTQNSTPVPEKKTEKVISGSAKTRKQSGIRKVAGEFFAEDATSVGAYVFRDVLLPGIIDIIVSVIKNSVDMLFYGDSGRKNTTSSRISYWDHQNGRRREDDRRYTRARSGYQLDEVVLEDRGDAERVLDLLEELIDTYGVVSVADMYDMVDMVPESTDYSYGWTDLHGAYVQRIRDGYLLKMPRVTVIK